MILLKSIRLESVAVYPSLKRHGMLYHGVGKSWNVVGRIFNGGNSFPAAMIADNHNIPILFNVADRCSGNPVSLWFGLDKSAGASLISRYRHP